MNKTIKHLRKREWSMGNGQCHDCCGSQPNVGWWTKTVGHERGCKLALCLEELREKVVWERENKSKATRTPKWVKELNKGFVDRLFDSSILLKMKGETNGDTTSRKE
jgi:hypothetical protein